MKFNCPFCGVELSAPDVAPGDVGDCPNCGRELKVPGGKRRIVVNRQKTHLQAGAGISSVPARKNAEPKSGRKALIIVSCVIFAIGVIVWCVARAEERERQREHDRAMASLEAGLSDAVRQADQTIEQWMRETGASEEDWRRHRERQKERREEQRHRELMRELRRSR